jgi:hypothetical protein
MEAWNAMQDNRTQTKYPECPWNVNVQIENKNSEEGAK